MRISDWSSDVCSSDLGYSSLSLLARLPIDYLKIDSGFTRSIDGNDRDRIVVRAIVDLARALGMLVVAEGLEHATQLARLQDPGVATWQGFPTSGQVTGNTPPGLPVLIFISPQHEK